MEGGTGQPRELDRPAERDVSGLRTVDADDD
jgi:hypothetical protein